MTTAIRYKDVRNTTGAPLTISNFPMATDGNDKQFKVVTRALAVADIGTGVGQTRNASGLIVEALTSNYSVLWAIGFVSRETAEVGTTGMFPYQLITGLIAPLPDPTAQANFKIGHMPEDNTIRLIDSGSSAATQLASGDIITLILILGSPDNAVDLMNNK